jgi:ABC-type branched-subunit amino acid transport system permease subunit
MGMKMENIITTVIWTVIGAAAVALIGSLIYFRAKKNPLAMLKANAIEVEVIKFQDVIAFFKNPARLEKLEKQKHLLAVAIKEVEADGTIFVQACLYDDEKEKVIDMENSFIVYKSKQMDDELTKNFGDKNMIVLQ